MYAVIESCGKQYKVAEGDVVFFEKLDTAEGKKVTFDKVILVSDDGKVQVGNPYVKGVKVEGKVVAGELSNTSTPKIHRAILNKIVSEVETVLTESFNQFKLNQLL